MSAEKESKKVILPFKIVFIDNAKEAVVVYTSDDAVALFTRELSAGYTLKCHGEEVFKCSMVDIFSVMNIRVFYKENHAFTEEMARFEEDGESKIVRV